MPEYDPNSKRAAAHRHNGILGGLGIAAYWLNFILRSPNTTEDAKLRAQRMLLDLHDLTLEVRKRIDPPA